MKEEEPKMKTGLYHEINIRRNPNNKILERNEAISYTNIAYIINKPYNTAKRKVWNNSFTVTEAFDILDGLGFKTKNKFEALKYLFSEYEE